MTSLNFDDDGQLGSMELYGLKLQKVVADFTEFDAITKKYVDDKVEQAKSELTNGASEALNTFKELEDYLKDSDVSDGLVAQINALSSQISSEASRAGTAEGKLDARVSSLESSSVSANLQTELDTTQDGAGLNDNGSYTTDPTKNYIQSASSLYEADSWLDYYLKEEEKKREEETGSLRTEINYVEAAAGLSAGGNYTADPNTTYLSLAVSLKDADTKLDAQLKAEVDRASGAESTIATNLATHKATYETDKKSNEEDKTAIGQRITDLTTEQIAEDPFNLYYTNQRVKNAQVHSYEYFNEDREYDAPVEISVGTAFSAIKAELQGIHAKEDTDDSRHTDLTVGLSTVSGALTTETTTARAEEKKVQDDVNEKDSAMSGRVEVFEEGMTNGYTSENELYQANISAQDAVDSLRGAINYVDGERFKDKELANSRHISSEGRHNGHDDKHASHEENLEELETQKFDKAGGEISGEVRVNLDASYFYLSSVWRIRTDAVGKRIVFEFNKDVDANEGEGDWVSGIPFISSH